MSQHAYCPTRRHPLWILLLLLLISLESYRLWSHGLINTSEGGLLEVGQNIFLLLACLLYSYHSRDPKADPLHRSLYLGLALLCLALLLREMDIDKIGEEASSRWQNIEWLVRSLTVMGILIYFGHLFRHPNIKICDLRSLASMPGLIFVYWGVFCYLGGWPFDKSVFAIPHALSAWVEETLELNAAILFFCTACIKFSDEEPSLLSDLVNDSRG